MANEKTASKYKALLHGKWPLLLLAATGMLLLLLGGGSDTAVVEQGGAQEASARTEAYRARLIEELTALCEAVDGAGQVQLVLTLAGGEEAVYATDTTQDGRSDYVLSGGQGLLLYYKNPTVQGVGVVCTGGNKPVVRQALTELLSATLGIGSNRICISYG